MAQTNSTQPIDKNVLKAQIDAEIAARLQIEAESALHTHRRGFHVGDLRLLVAMDVTSEVLEMPPIFRLPGAPTGVKGLVNRHGRVVPVVDILDLYGLKHDPVLNSWLLVCGRGDEAVGIIIDSLPERKKFVDGEIGLAGISHPIAACAKSAYREGKDVWIDLDTEALFVSIFHVDPSST